MTNKLKRFLDNRKESDFIDKNAYASRKAKSFLNTDAYKDNEKYKGNDIHVMLLVLRDPSQEI